MSFRPRRGLPLYCILPGSIPRLHYYSLMLPSFLQTSMAGGTIDFLTDVTYDTVKRLKRHLAIFLTDMLIYYNIHDTTNMFQIRVPSFPNYLIYPLSTSFGVLYMQMRPEPMCRWTYSGYEWIHHACHCGCDQSGHLNWSIINSFV
jgi:hypothetical protein